ncbi:hypothetical protein [Methylobacterium sp. SI9]|uniref:hypothetical protein n=1 Tax=Methylobacterium guangdongense TaxID=3138811 RepID=UPI00313E3555
MKRYRYLTAVLLWSVFPFNQSFADKNNICVAANTLRSELIANGAVSSEDNIDRIVIFLAPIAKGRRKFITNQDADCIIDLLITAIPYEEKQNSTDLTCQLDGIWNTHTNELSSAVSKRNPSQQHYLQLKRAYGRKLMRSGNG